MASDPSVRWGDGTAMIDNFALGLTHGLMMLAALMLLRRRDLDDETPEVKGKRRG